MATQTIRMVICAVSLATTASLAAGVWTDSGEKLLTESDSYLEQVAPDVLRERKLESPTLSKAERTRRNAMNCQLFDAIMAFDFAAADHAIASGANVNGLCVRGFDSYDSILHSAISDASEEALTKSLAKDEDESEASEARFEKKLKRVQWLLGQASIDPNKFYNLETPLSRAIHSVIYDSGEEAHVADLDMIDLLARSLVEAGANPGMRMNFIATSGRKANKLWQGRVVDLVDEFPEHYRVNDQTREYLLRKAQ